MLQQRSIFALWVSNITSGDIIAVSDDKDKLKKYHRDNYSYLGDWSEWVMSNDNGVEFEYTNCDDNDITGYTFHKATIFEIICL